MYITFKHKRVEINSVLFLSGYELKKVSEVKYLGVILTDDLKIDKDTNRALNSFLGQFNSMFHKFSFVDSNIMFYLFKTYTSSFYDVELWYNGITSASSLRLISVGYHKAVKKLAGLNYWDSNHEACNIVGVDIFKHLQAKRMLNLYFKALDSRSRFMQKMKYYFSRFSFVKSMVEEYFLKHYDIARLSSNPKCAILARINFVQLNEPRSSYIY